MPLRRTLSSTSLNADSADRPSGPLSGPSTTEWRRQRLLQIGSNTSASAVETGDTSETSALRPSPQNRAASYGTLPAAATAAGVHGNKQKTTFRTRHALGALPSLSIPKGGHTNPPSLNTPRSLRNSFFATQRPISAYDRPVVPEEAESEVAIKTNGIRVWYSSFTSIDWLHDAIKDSARLGALRKRRSRRARIRRQIDRSIGWVAVTIIGFLTAVVAFLIVRSEQWLFDIKEGRCITGIWKAKRFCCPVKEEDVSSSVYTPSFLTMTVEEACPSWQTWGEFFTPVASRSDWLEVEGIEYAIYTVIAVCLALSLHMCSLSCSRRSPLP